LFSISLEGKLWFQLTLVTLCNTSQQPASPMCWNTKLSHLW